MRKAHQRLTNSTQHGWAETQMIERPSHQHRKQSSSLMMSAMSHRKPSASSMDRMPTHDKDKPFNVTVRTTFSRRQGSISSKNVPMYVNVTGPGDYDVPGFL